MRNFNDVKLEKVGFGGGCHWCTEAVFQSLRGVVHVDQGWISSTPPHEAFSEAVSVTFDPELISLDILIEIHLRTHASGAAHSMRDKYRSAVYVFEKDQASRGETILSALRLEFPKPLITEILPFSAFKPPDESYQDYYVKNPARPFCETYIDPKLSLLRQRFALHLKDEAPDLATG